MKVLTCGATRRRLHAFHDQELPYGDQIAVSAHLDWCDECAGELAQLRLVGRTLRTSMHGRAGLSAEEETSLRQSVVSRIKAEQTVSFVGQAREMFVDMHLVYAGLGGAAAATVCVLIMLGMFRFAANERPDSLAGMVAVLGSPGSNFNPVRPEFPPVPPLEARVQMPRVLNQAFSTDPDETGDSLIMIAGIITREGTVVDLALLDPGGGRSSTQSGQTKAVEDLLGAVSRARFEPARVDGLPVAVNMVWVVEHTTVRATRAGKKRAAASTPVGINA
jgi:Putative zinc-finger